MARRIYLVRHGLKESLMGDPVLTEAGRQQAEKTAVFFDRIPVDLILTSPLKRTQETAEFIAQKTQTQFVVNPLLKERINWGDDATESFSDFLAAWIKSTRDRNWDPPHGDSSIKAGERIEKVVNQVADSYQHIVLVTHGGVITDFLRNVFDDQYLNSHSWQFSVLRELSIKECSITTLEIENDQLKLIKLACCDHL